MSTLSDVEWVDFASEETFRLGGREYPNRLIFRYDTSRYDLRTPVAEFFGTDDLEHLHLTRFYDRTQPGKKNSLAVGNALRAAVTPNVAILLQDLIYEHIATFMGPIVGHQPAPMLRVNFHGSRAILRFHRDSEYGQAPNLINLWIPITSVGGTNSMYLESVPDACDFAPLKLSFGQACIFRGFDLLHGAMDNDSGSTRISIDLRFVV